MNTLGMVLAAAALSASGTSQLIEMGTTVSGNQEQPRVLYIVPWRTAEGPDKLYQDFSSRMDNLLEPVERESFQRELQLRQRFHHSPVSARDPGK